MSIADDITVLAFEFLLRSPLSARHDPRRLDTSEKASDRGGEPDTPYSPTEAGQWVVDGARCGPRRGPADRQICWHPGIKPQRPCGTSWGESASTLGNPKWKKDMAENGE